MQQGNLSPPSPAQRRPIPVYHLRTNVEWPATIVVKPRQLIQRLSAFLVFLSTTFSGKTALFISTSQNKTCAFAMVLRVSRRSATPEDSRSACHHARGLFLRKAITPPSTPNKSHFIIGKELWKVIPGMLLVDTSGRHWLRLTIYYGKSLWIEQGWPSWWGDRNWNRYLTQWHPVAVNNSCAVLSALLILTLSVTTCVFIFQTERDRRKSSPHLHPGRKRHKGSFVERQVNIQLPWQQRVWQMQGYDVCDVEIAWIQVRYQTFVCAQLMVWLMVVHYWRQI